MARELSESWTAEEFARYVRLGIEPVAKREPLAPPIDEMESDFQRKVCICAKAGGFTWHHVVNSRKSKAGWFDLTMARDHGTPMLVFCELKKKGGHSSPAQKAWYKLMKHVADVVNELAGREMIGVYTWWPKDLADVERLLS